MAPPPMILGLAPAMSAVGGRTPVPRIRISRPDAGNARCSVSRAPAQRKDFSPLTLLAGGAAVGIGAFPRMFHERALAHSLIKEIIRQPPSRTRQILPSCSAFPVQAHAR